jgi:2-oxoisovalerate dehydrogenase E1 component beta subunit
MAAITYLEAIRQALIEEMERDSNVILMGEDIGVYGGAFKVTDGLIDQFGADRIIDTPISEAAIVGAATGAALLGLRPIVEMQFIDFISCAFNHLTNFVGTLRYRMGSSIPMVVRGPCGGGVGAGPYHSQNVEVYFFHTPGLKIVSPATPTDAKGLLKAAIRDDDPVLYFEHKYLYRRLKEELPELESDSVVPIGKAAVRKRGQDLTIITYGAMVHKSLEAASMLQENEGIDIEVLDLRTLKPLDDETILSSAQKTSKTLIVHEDTKSGGLAGEITARITEKIFEHLDGPIIRVTAADTPVPYSGPLEEFFLPQVEDIVAAARWLAEY